MLKFKQCVHKVCHGVTDNVKNMLHVYYVYINYVYCYVAVIHCILFVQARYEYTKIYQDTYTIDKSVHIK